MSTLPASFRWGVATAAYQIEGAAREDGRGRSIWDTFSHTPGRVRGGDTGDTATDHYHRWREDIALLRELGVDAYRLSIAWPRVQPTGRGELNPAGVRFYRELLTELRAAGIAPYVTLYHWDLPQELQDAGGWPVRETALAFADYAAAMARELGDLVDTWITLNEPWCTAFLGYGSGVHAPGITDDAAALAAAHHLNLAHGLAARAIRAELGEDTRISISLNLHVFDPADEENTADLAAVEQVSLVGNKIFLGPLMDATYPTELIRLTRPLTDWSFVQPGDLELCRVRLDVLGFNYYTVQTVRARTEGEAGAAARAEESGDAGPNGEPGASGDAAAVPTCWPACENVEFLPPAQLSNAADYEPADSEDPDEGWPVTDMGWAVEPRGLYDLIAALDTAYEGTALAITENGAAYPDTLTDGAVHDEQRVEYLRAHIAEVRAAVADGAPVEAYFAWSLLDNFEWAEGYAKRFGLYYVDYATQRRYAKDSAHYYREVIAAHRAEVEQARASEKQVAARADHGEHTGVTDGDSSRATAAERGRRRRRWWRKR